MDMADNSLQAHEPNRLSPVEELELEIEIKNIDTQLTQTKQLQKTQQELKDAYEKFGQMYKTQRDLREQIDVLQTNWREANEKNTETMKCSTTIDDHQVVKLTAERDEAIIVLRELQNGNEKEKHDLKQCLDDLIAQNTALNDQLFAEIETINEYQAEIASIKQESESELATLQENHRTIFEEKKNLADEILVIKQSNARMTDEIDEITNKLSQRDDELEKMAEKFNAKENHLAQVRKFALKQKNSFLDLQKEHEALVAEKAAKPHNQFLNDAIKELNSSIAVKQQQNEALRLENETLSKRLNDLDAKHAFNANTIQILIEETKHSRLELTAIKTQSKYRIKGLTDQDKENKVAIACLTRENKTLQARFAQLDRQLTDTPTMTTNKKTPSDAALTPIAGMLSKK